MIELLVVLNLILTGWVIALEKRIPFKFPKRHSRSVVHVVHTDGSRGTGFVATAGSGKKVIITNKHVCAPYEGDGIGAKIYIGIGNTRIATTILDVYRTHDLCMIEMVDRNIPAVVLAKHLRFGRVFTYGFPWKTTLSFHHGSITQMRSANLPNGLLNTECFGIFYKWDHVKNRCVDVYPTVYTTAITGPGGSGSPVWNRHGEVVGVINLHIIETLHAGFVPLSFLQHFLEQH